MDGDIDFSVVAAIIVIIVAIIASIYASRMYYTHVVDAPFKKQCETNPKERYAQQCIDYEDCVILCTKRLKTESSS